MAADSIKVFVDTSDLSRQIDELVAKHTLGDEAALEALVSCMRTSAQDTLAALRQRGYSIVRKAQPPVGYCDGNCGYGFPHVHVVAP